MDDGLILLKESSRYPGLYTKKYKKRVFYDNLWDEELIECRGHVQLSDGTIVVNPFTKVFNYLENGTTIDLDEECVYVRKVNGFMAAATYVRYVDSVVVSTTGSLDSDYVDMAEEYITQELKDYIRRYYSRATLLFEICHPNDPHIIPEMYGCYLIGQRRVDYTKHYFANLGSERTLDFMANYHKLIRPYFGLAKFGDILEKVKFVNHEGYMVYGQKSGKVLKLKSPYYLTMKAIARIKDLSKLDKRRVDEEFYPLLDHVKSVPQFPLLEEQDKLKLLRDYYGK